MTLVARHHGPELGHGAGRWSGRPRGKASIGRGHDRCRGASGGQRGASPLGPLWTARPAVYSGHGISRLDRSCRAGSVEPARAEDGPCRPTPVRAARPPFSAAVGRRDAHHPWAGAPDHRTDLVVLSLVDSALRDRRAVLSPWDGTAPNPAPPSVGRRACIPPCHPLPVRTTRPARAPPCGVRPETAVPSYPRGAARLLTRLRRLVGGEPAYRRVVPVRTIGPPARPPGRVPRPPCRLIPVGRHGSYPPRRPLRRRGVETAVSPCPRGTAPDRPRRPRAERPEAAVSSQPRGPARRLVRRAAAGRRGSDRRVALGGGRRATRPEPPRRSLRPGSGAARTAVPSSLPRTARLPTTAVPRGAARTAVSLRVARRSGWCGTTVPAGVHPPAARCLPQPCALGRISQALTKRCCRAVTLDRCSG